MNTGTPRRNGTRRIGCLSRFMPRSSTFVFRVPSARRQTIACFFGPRIRIPSISACPPMLVLNAQLSFLFVMALSLSDAEFFN